MAETATTVKPLDISTVKLADLDGKLIHIDRPNATGTTYTLDENILLNVFKVVGNEVFDFEPDGKGAWVQSTKALAKVDTDKKEVEYLASRFVENPYERFGNSHKESFVGEAGVALLQGLKLYLQSFGIFAFDPYLVTESQLANAIKVDTDAKSNPASSAAPASSATSAG